jgi:type VI secretion system secreted protein Hcp
MAVDMFLKLGDIEGEAFDSTNNSPCHAKEIQVLSWSWGVSNSGSAAFGGGAGTGKANFSDLSLTKPVDKSTPGLWENCCSGSQYATAVFTMRKAGGKKPLEFLVINFGNVMVSSVSSGSGGDDLQTENLSLHFQNFKMTYKMQDESGGDAGDTSGSWDIATTGTLS